jgi:hypothetical protein
VGLIGPPRRGELRSGLGVTRLGASRAAGGERMPLVWVLESDDEGAEALLSALAGDFDLRLVHAPRRADPRRYGRPLEHGHWLVGPCDAPDPHALFATLRALEALLLEMAAAEARPGLVAWGEGASLALALASCLGDRLGPVVAIGGGPPALPPEVEGAELSGLPILRVSGRGTGRSSADAERAEQDRRWAELERRGARITYQEQAGPEEPVLPWLREAVVARA